MKRKLTSSFIIIILAVLGVLGYDYFGEAETDRGVWGSSKSYETLKDIKSEADLVVRAHVPLHYDIREFSEEGRTTKQAFYEVAIDEVFIDRTGRNFDEDSQIIVNQLIGFKDLDASNYTVQKGMKPVKTGEYLLFLKKMIHPSDGNIYFVSNSPQHLYKWRGNKTYRNIASDELLEIKYEEMTGGE